MTISNFNSHTDGTHRKAAIINWRSLTGILLFVFPMFTLSIVIATAAIEDRLCLLPNCLLISSPHALACSHSISVTTFLNTFYMHLNSYME